MTPQEAIQKLRSLPEEQQRAVLSRLSPDERSGILKQLSEPQTESIQNVPGAVPGMAEPNARPAPPELQKVASPLTAVKEFGKGFVQTIPSMVEHPIQTAASMGQPFTASGIAPEGYPGVMPVATGTAPENASVRAEAEQGQRGQAQAIKENPAYALGGAASLAAAGKLATFAAPAIEGAGEAIRTAAIGDPDAAALRGLRIPAGSPKSLGTLKAVERARPYLQGVQSLEELQGRIPQAKAEVWGPYQQTVDAIGGKQVMGPEGPTTVKALEDERLQISALLRELKNKNPEAIQLAQQKGLTQADLLAREKAVQSALDPHLEEAGIAPKAIRQTFGSVAKIGERVSGKSTLAEKPQQYGLGRIANLSIEHPLAAPKEILGGIRDIAAGRPWFQGSPTDIGIREAFRTAGEKPWLGRFSRPLTEPPQLEANVPGNAPYGESFAEGPISSAPVRVGQAPPSRLALPSATEAGEAQPMIGVLKHPGAMRSFQPETTRIAPPQFAGPEPTPPRNLVITPSGEVHNLPRYQLSGGFTTPPVPEPTEAHVFPAGSQFRGVQETPYYPPGSQFRGKIAPFDVEEYLKGNQ